MPPDPFLKVKLTIFVNDFELVFILEYIYLQGEAIVTTIKSHGTTYVCCVKHSALYTTKL